MAWGGSSLSWLLLISLFPRCFALLWLGINSYTCTPFSLQPSFIVRLRSGCQSMAGAAEARLHCGRMEAFLVSCATASLLLFRRTNVFVLTCSGRKDVSVKMLRLSSLTFCCSGHLDGRRFAHVANWVFVHAEAKRWRRFIKLHTQDNEVRYSWDEIRSSRKRLPVVFQRWPELHLTNCYKEAANFRTDAMLTFASAFKHTNEDRWFCQCQ